MKTFILSVAIMLGTVFAVQADDIDLFDTSDNSESGFEFVYKDGEYKGTILNLSDSIFTFTPAGKEAEPNITCVRADPIVSCY